MSDSVRSFSGDPRAHVKIGGLPGPVLVFVAWVGLTTTLLLLQQRSVQVDESLWVLEAEERREIARKVHPQSPSHTSRERFKQGIAKRIHTTRTPDPVTPQESTSEREVPDHPEPNLLVDDIFISVKTSGKFHTTRLQVVLRTWWNFAKNQTYIFTDVDDEHLSNVTGGHIVNTKCGDTHHRMDLCCKMGYEYDAFVESGKKWWCHFDDDNYVNVNALLKVLRDYDWRSEMYIGKPSISHGVEAIYQKREKVKFWFLTGGAGVCISKRLSEGMTSWCRHGELEETCNELHLPDDCTIGFIINNRLGVDLTVREEFSSHLQPLSLIPRIQLPSQVTLSYYLDEEKGTANLIRLDEKSLLFTSDDDPTRLLSYHCLLYPNVDWCLAQTSIRSQNPIV